MIANVQVYQREIKHLGAEGSITDAQIAFLHTYLLDRPEIQRIAETGFNVGVSACTFLVARGNIQVVSFDWLRQPMSSLYAKQTLDEWFPERHTLVAGDSRHTLAAFGKLAGGALDMAFIDGGHIWPTPLDDIINLLPLLKIGGTLIMDDYCPKYGTEGVIRAWDLALEKGLLKTTEGPFTDDDRGWIVGEKL